MAMRTQDWERCQGVHVVSLHFWNVLLDDDIQAFPYISLLGFSIPGVSGAWEMAQQLQALRKAKSATPG